MLVELARHRSESLAGAEASSISSTRWRTTTPRRGQVEGWTRLALATTVALDRAIDPLPLERSAISGGTWRRPRHAAAQTLVVELDEPDVGLQPVRTCW